MKRRLLVAVLGISVVVLGSQGDRAERLAGTAFAAEGKLPVPVLDQPSPQETPSRWTADRAWDWYHRQPWFVGCNFLPSTAVNDVEMWQREDFDPETIDRELGWAEGLGFNTVRVFLNYVVWESDAEGLKQRMVRFLEIAGRHRIGTMFILFDDCFKPEPRVGKQEAPVPGVHNSQWVQSPGARRRSDQKAWPLLEKYVKDIVGRFGQDKRVVVWDLYNEPTQSLSLVEATFRWARQAKPSQPLTTCIFGPPSLAKRIPELSDIISFHDYGALPGLKGQVDRLKVHRRPILCTEWMARGQASTFSTHLPFFKAEKIGCWNWGLVGGRTQTYYPWGSKPDSAEPSPWHHDILRKDGSPYSEQEARAIRIVTGILPGDGETSPVRASQSQASPPEKKLTKLPAKLGTNVMESTPLVYQGRRLMFHSRRVDTPKSDLSQMYLFLVDQETGKELTRFGARHSLGSALVHRDEIHVFAADHSENDWFHDIYHFRSTDLKTWTRQLAIRREESEHLLNSSVCQDEQGFIMAYESNVPVAFCFTFARSKDLAAWEKVPGLVFTGVKSEYSACPVIRYFKPYYYVIYLHAAIPGHNGWVSFLARSKDLATWQLSPKNPILEAGPGEGRNNSDVDLIEIDGKTYVYYCTGDQQTWGDLKCAVYPGPMAEFFASYFPSGEKMIEVSAKR